MRVASRSFRERVSREVAWASLAASKRLSSTGGGYAHAPTADIRLQAMQAIKV